MCSFGLGVVIRDFHSPGLRLSSSILSFVEHTLLTLSLVTVLGSCFRYYSIFELVISLVITTNLVPIGILKMLSLLRILLISKSCAGDEVGLHRGLQQDRLYQPFVIVRYIRQIQSLCDHFSKFVYSSG